MKLLFILVIPEEGINTREQETRLFTEKQEIYNCFYQRDPMDFAVESFVFKELVCKEVLLFDENVYYDVV